MKNNIKALIDWYDMASPEHRILLAKKIGCSTHYVYLLRNEIRGITPEYAMKIEKATSEINKKYPHLPVIRQPQICHVCSNCPYTK